MAVCTIRRRIIGFLRVTVQTLNRHAIVIPDVIDAKTVGVVIVVTFAARPDGVIPDIGVHMADQAGVVIIISMCFVFESYIALTRNTEGNIGMSCIDCRRVYITIGVI